METLVENTILVTGAGRGLGASIAQRLVAYGARVIAVSRTESELEWLSASVRGSKGTLTAVPVDLGNRDAVQSLIQTISDEFGGIDTLINNAAVLRMKRFEELTEQEFENTLEVNLLAPISLIRGFLPGMKKRGRGAIINVTSGAATRGFDKETDYCTTKYGIEGFSHSLAIELAGDNISVNLVTPGYSIKPTSVTAAEFDEWSQEQKDRYRDPIEMTDAFAYLATQYPQEGGITGTRFDAFKLSKQARANGWGLPS